MFLHLSVILLTGELSGYLAGGGGVVRGAKSEQRGSTCFRGGVPTIWEYVQYMVSTHPTGMHT